MEGVVETAADQSCEQVILSAMSYTPQTKLNDVGTWIVDIDCALPEKTDKKRRQKNE